MEYIECYSEKSRVTPLFGEKSCLENHLQYVCGNCGRCICANKDEKRGLRRCDFPFKSPDEAKIYIRVADYINKKCCGIYEIKDLNGRKSYKIFKDIKDLEKYLAKNKNKFCENKCAVFKKSEYSEYPGTYLKHLNKEDEEKYLKEKQANA